MYGEATPSGMTRMRIVPTTTDAHIAGFHHCVDVVARERRYLGLVEGPPIGASIAFVTSVRADDGVHLVALDGDEERVVGWCDVVRFPLEGFRHGGRLGMGLLPEVRGRGLGRRLLDEGLAAAGAKGFERVELDVFASNARAHALYLKAGFVEEGRRRGGRKLDGRYDDNILMTRWLVPPPA